MNNKSESTDTLATLLGGENITIRKLDGSTEEVFVRQLPVKLMPKLLKVGCDEPAQVELFCDKPAGWSEILPRDEYEKLVQCGLRLNKDFFERWQRRQLDQMEIANPGAKEIVRKAMEQAVKASTSLSPGSL